MNSLKDETIHKIFGAHLQGGMGLALSLLERASAVNWEALWPQFQKAMIGLGVVAIATLQGEAIRRGLSELAERIASFQPTVSPMPGEPLTWAEAMPVPYVPAPAFPETIERVREYPPEAIEISKATIGPLTDAQDEFDDVLTELIQSPPNDPKRKDLCDRLLRTMPKLELWIERLGTPSAATERMFKLAYEWLDKKGCGPRWSNK